MINEGPENMKTLDFRGEISSNGQIAVPRELAAQIPCGEKLEVVLRWGEAGDEEAWREAGGRRFEAAYADEDSIYEELMDGDASAR